MARAIAVEIVGDASSVNRAFRSASVNATKFDRSLGKSVRGAVAGTGVFRGLGRSLAFASGGFLAFEGIAGTISAALHGAENLSKAQEGLSVAIKNTGGNLRVLKARYTEIAKGAAQFGVSQVDATTALEKATVLTGSAAKAQRAYEEALVISHAIGKDFNSTLTATAKAQEGITTSLQRYGIQIKKNTPGVQQLQIVMARFRGEAVANTSAADKFRAVWANTEVILGQALLPVLDKYLSRLSNWLEKMQRSGRLQRDVNAAVHGAVGLFQTLAGVVRVVDKVTGSFAHTLELLATIKLASWTADGILGLRGLTAGFRRAGGAAVVAEGEIGGLRGALLALGGASVLGPLTAVAGALAAIAYFSANDTPYQRAGTAHSFPVVTDQNTGKSYIASPRGLVPTTNPNPNAYDSGGGTRGARFGHHRPPHLTPPNTGTSAPDHARTRQHLIRTFTLPPGLVTAQLKAQAGLGSILKADEAIRNYILRLLHSGRLRGKALQQAYQELASVNAEIASQINKATGAAKKARDKAAKAAQAAAQFNVPIALQIADARAQALGLDETKILLKMKRAAERALRSGRLNAQGQINAWNEIASVNQQLNSAATSALGSFKQINTRKFVDSIKGLTADQKKALRAKLSQLGPGNTVPNQGVGAYGYQINPNTDRPIVIHHTTKLDGKVVARNTTRHQQRHHRRNPSQRRGPNAATTG